MTGTDTPFTHRKVMFIDDNKVDRYICERISKKCLFAEEVISMESAQDALVYLIALKDNPYQLPELIFLDINMPVMSGFDFLEAYKDLDDNIKQHCIVIMLTTSLNADDKERASNNIYVKGYINKPLNEEKINGL